MRGLLLPSLMAVAACSVTDTPFRGVDAGTDPVPPAAFQIDAIEPGDGEVDVSRTSTVVVTLSAPVAGSSLSPASLVVTDQDGAPVAGTTIASDRTIVFTPDVGLARVRSYEVTLAADVVDTSGRRLDAGRTWQFRTADGAWSPPTALSGDDVVVSLPRLAFAASGYAFATWYEQAGTPPTGSRVVRSRLFSPPTGWGAPHDLSGAGLAPVSDLAIAMTPAGGGFVLWNEELTTVERRIAVIRYDSEDGWGDPAMLTAGLAASDDRVIVAAGDGEHAHVMFSRDGIPHATRRPWDSFEEWDTLAPLAAVEDGPGQDFGLQYDGSGDAVAAWVERDRRRVFAHRFRLTGASWNGLPEAVSDAQGAQSSPALAMDGAGRAAIVWIQEEPGGARRPMFAEQAPNDAWSEATALASDVSIVASAPRVLLGPRGTAVAAWSQFDDGRSNLWSSYRTGGVWSTPAPIEDDADWESSPVRLAFDEAGRVLAVWTAARDVQAVLWSRRFVPGVGWLALSRVAPGHDGVASEPVVAFDAAGNGLVVWQGFDRVRQTIWASRFE